MKDIQAVIARLKALSTAVAEQNWSEFTMRVPAEPSRDADIVLQRSAMALERLEIVEQQLDKAQKQNVLLREAIATLHKGGVMGFDRDGMRLCAEVLAATADLAGLVVCDAEPYGYLYEAENDNGFILTHELDGAEPNQNWTKLYKARSTK